MAAVVEITDSEIEQALARVLSTAAFQRSPSLSRLLRFIVGCAAREQSEELTETLIAQRVFGAPAAFNPRIDITVEVHIRRLRKRLEEYGHTHGHHDPLRITLSEKSFLPTFKKTAAGAAARSA